MSASQDKTNFTTYQETLDYLYSRLPMFTRQGDSAIKKDLTNTIEICRELGNPHDKFKSVHIGGTNGKGSTSHMLAAILQTAGYKTGLYTSPHLKDFRERIRVNGKMIPEQIVADFVTRLKDTIERISPSFFEVTVAMAFDYFVTQQVDIAIIEVGLGGRLDSTNIITPQLSVITNIGYDHVSILGNTLTLIAGEKAGIIKPGVPVVIGEEHPETKPVFERKAADCGSKLVFASRKWEIVGERIVKDPGYMNVQASSSGRTLDLDLDLTGSYQLKNLATVLEAIGELRQAGLHITDSNIRTALANVKELTGLMGRWQTLRRDPLVICDTGHNEDGIREVLKNIDAQPYEQLRMVIGMVKDKDISAILALLPKDATYYFCQPDLPRAKLSEELMLEAAAFGLSGNAYPNVKEALFAAEAQANENDLIFVGGSTFVVAEII